MKSTTFTLLFLVVALQAGPTPAPSPPVVDVIPGFSPLEASDAAYLVTSCSQSCWSWRKNETPTPLQRLWPALAFDPDRHVAVVHGGISADEETPLRGDTWMWNGLGWSPQSVAGPSPRFGHAMVYDSERRVMVLFGGVVRCACVFEYCGCVPAPGSTWEWDGASWHERDVAGPASRFQPMLAFDGVRGVTVLVTSSDAQTWEWDGDRWRRTFVEFPDGNHLAGLVYDPTRQRVIGVTSSCTTWSWDGQSWMSDTLGRQYVEGGLDDPGVRSEPALADCRGKLYTDPSTDRVVLFRENGSSVWILQPSGWALLATIDDAGVWDWDNNYLLHDLQGPRWSDVFAVAANRSGTWDLVSATDVDGDGDYDLLDVAETYACFGDTSAFGPCSGLDLNGDAAVNLDDYGPCFSNLTGPE